jgi:hypothetical protein
MAMIIIGAILNGKLRMLNKAKETKAVSGVKTFSGLLIT